MQIETSYSLLSSLSINCHEEFWWFLNIASLSSPFKLCLCFHYFRKQIYLDYRSWYWRKSINYNQINLQYRAGKLQIFCSRIPNCKTFVSIWSSASASAIINADAVLIDKIFTPVEWRFCSVTRSSCSYFSLITIIQMLKNNLTTI